MRAFLIARIERKRALSWRLGTLQANSSEISLVVCPRAPGLSAYQRWFSRFWFSDKQCWTSDDVVTEIDQKDHMPFLELPHSVWIHKPLNSLLSLWYHYFHFLVVSLMFLLFCIIQHWHFVYLPKAIAEPFFPMDSIERYEYASRSLTTPMAGTWVERP